MTDLPFLTIAEASKLIATRKLSPVELTDAYLARIALVDDDLKSFITVVPERARHEARDAEASIMSKGPRTPLHGIPYSLKDIFETAGIRTTAQSRLLADNIPKNDSRCQELLSQAGAILLGKNTTFEFAHGGPSWDVVAPPARNPWNLDYAPAGSSSGSAAAVAAGLVPASLGSDTGGSIRGPASACGIAGLKPTYGRVSRRGVIPNCFSHDHAGPLAWTVEDIALILQQIAGYDPLDLGSAKVAVPNYADHLTEGAKGLVIGVPHRWLDNEAPPSAATMTAFKQALDVFVHLGAVIRNVELPPLKIYDASKKVIAMADLFTIHAENMRTRPEMFGEMLRQRIIAGGLIRAEDYVKAMQIRASLAAAMQAQFENVDLIMLPTAEPAGKLQPTPASALFSGRSYCTAFNVAGNPALSVCSGFAANGMPFSLQIVGRLFDEEKVLQAGYAYEAATTWRSLRPTLHRSLEKVEAV